MERHVFMAESEGFAVAEESILENDFERGVAIEYAAFLPAPKDFLALRPLAQTLHHP
jgi:hypothetical protein